MQGQINWLVATPHCKCTLKLTTLIDTLLAYKSSLMSVLSHSDFALENRSCDPDRDCLEIGLALNGLLVGRGTGGPNSKLPSSFPPPAACSTPGGMRGGGGQQKGSGQKYFSLSGCSLLSSLSALFQR